MQNQQEAQNTHKRLIFVIGLIAVAAVSGFGEDYDGEKVRPVMQNNLAQIRALGSLIEEQEYYEIAAAFFSLAEGMMTVLPMDPPRGEEEHWKDTIMEVIKVAFLGVGACAVQYDAGIQDAFSDLRGLMAEGHSEHQPPRG